MKNDDLFDTYYRPNFKESKWEPKQQRMHWTTTMTIIVFVGILAIQIIGVVS